MNSVYVMSNPSMPGVVKIGCCIGGDPEARAADLHTTGVPTPFRVEHVVEHETPYELEASVHRELAEYRVSSSREFFHVPPNVARRTVDRLASEAALERRINDVANRPMVRFSNASEIGGAIRDARRSKGLTQASLAQLAGVGVRVVIEVEAGKDTAQLGIALRLCEAAGLVLSVGSNFPCGLD